MASRIDPFLELLVKNCGSDLHLLTGHPPRIRVRGAVEKVPFRALEASEVEGMLAEILSERHRQMLARRHTVDFAYESETAGRFRVSAYQQAGGPAATFRPIVRKIPTMEELGLPAVVSSLIRQPSGLTIVTGPAGAGKSTTLAAMIDSLNASRRGHILTIEDPIEFSHTFHQCLVTQREVGLHAPTFAEALRSALHEDPDVILVGEMRDHETISLALTASEMGIQVLASLHTNGAVRSIDRIINAFPTERHDLVRSMMAENLRLVIAQQLVPTSRGEGRVAALEILVNTAAASSLIRSGKTHQLSQVLQSGRKLGMVAMDAHLAELAQRRVISADTARDFSLDRGRPASSNERREVA
jgi:twitching motility protein PilT